MGPARYQNYSVQMELFLTDFISANYQFDLAYRSDNYRHFHTPLGLIGGPPLIIIGLLSPASDTTSEFSLGKGGALLGLLLLIAPDGFALHAPIGSHIDISPYGNFLGLDFIRNRTTNEKWIKYAGSYGIKISYLHKSNFTLSVFGERRKAARFPWMSGIGFGMGYYF